MAKVELCLVRQAVNLADRVVKLTGVSAGEITPGGTESRREERVSDKCRFANQIGHAVIGVAGCFHYPDFKISYRKDVSLTQQKIELASIDRHLRNIEYLRKGFLYRTYAFAAGNPRSGALADFAGCGQMISMCMGFQHPFDAATFIFCSIQHPVNERKVPHSTDWIVHPYGIDNGRNLAFGIGQEVSPGT